MYGERIRELRKIKNMTMKELGKRLNLAESTISGYENEARKPDLEVMRKLAEFFDVSVDYILGVSDNKGVDIKTSDEINIAFFGGRKEELSEEEAAHLEESLELFRILQAKKMAEKNKKK